MPLHGITTVTDQGGYRPVNIDDTATIVLVGTAPDADAAVFPLNKPVLVAGSYRVLAKLDTSVASERAGTLLAAAEAIFAQQRCRLVIVRVTEGADSAETQANIQGTTDANGVNTGLRCAYDVQALLGYKPRVLIAPGFSHLQAVATDMVTIGEALRMQVFADCPGQQPATAWAYKDNFDSKYLELCWPAQKNTVNETVPLSAYRAGLEAQKDADPQFGYSASASNRVINGTLGGTFLVDYRDGDAACTAQLLNENQVTTCINDDGYRLWGNRNTSSDAKWQFTAHVKTNDVILDSIATALKWARDRKIVKTFVEDVLETINNFLYSQEKAGHLLGGKAWADKEINTPAVILAGQFYVDYDFTPPGIAESITVTSHFVNDYAESVI